MTISTALEDIQANITQAAEDDGRSNTDVTLIAVSKKQPEERIDEALSCGLRIFGEIECKKRKCAGQTVKYSFLI